MNTTIVGAPTAPTGLTATPDINSITLTWEAPSSDGDSLITGYTVQHSAEGAPWKTIRDGTSTDDNDPSDRSIVVDNLLASTQHSFRVAAINDIGFSIFSTIETVNTTAATVPSIPSNLIAIPSADTITLTWDAPHYTGGSPITGYTVQHSAEGAPWETIRDGTATDDNDPSDRSIVVDKLLASTQHSFRVAAINDIGSSVYSANATVNTTVATVPNTPSGLTATPDIDYIILTWEAPSSDGGSPITGYTVQHSTDGAYWKTIRDGTAIDDDPSDRSIVVDGLQPNTQHSFTVYAVNIVGSSAFSAPETVNTTIVGAPTAPTGLTATPDINSITLTWEAPSSDGDSLITGYTVQHSAEGAPWETIRDGTATDDNPSDRSIVVDNLLASTQHSFRVAAINDIGFSVFSTIETVNTLDPTIPYAPAGLIATSDVNSIALTWDAPFSNGGSAITGYTVDYAIVPSGTWQTQDSALVMNTTRETTISGLDDNTQYNLRVAAINDVGTGTYSDNATATTDTITTPPNAPTIQNEFVTTTDSITMIWNVPDDNGGSAIIGYTVDYAIVPSGTWQTQDSALVMNTTRETTISGLDDGVEYNLRVAAINDVGTGTYSDNATATTDTITTPPNAPTIQNEFVTTTDSITMIWNVPDDNGGSAIIGYTVDYAIVPSGTWQTQDSALVMNTTRETTISGLDDDTQYNLRVAAVNDVGTGTYSDNATATTDTIITTPPNAPTIQNEFVTTTDSITMIWNVPDDNGGSAIIGYTVDYAIAPSGTWQTQDSALVMNTTRETTISGLDDDTQYNLRVAAINDVGTGTYSDNATATTDTIITTPPNAPTIQNEFVTTTDSITMIWNVPDDNGGSAIIGYTVDYAIAPSGTWQTQSDSALVMNTTRETTISGLDDGVEYNLRVAAINDVGTGTYSDNATATTDTIITTPPNAPTIQNEFVTTTDSITMIWNVPDDNGGSAIIGYTVDYAIAPSGTWQTQDSALVMNTTRETTISGLDDNTQYNLRVAAINDVGTGTYSDNATATTDTIITTPPNAPTIQNEFVTTTDSITMIWNVPDDNGGSPIIGYTVDYAIVPSGTWQTQPGALVMNTTRETTISGLDDNTQYNLRVAAVNDVGTGTYSDNATATTDTIITTPPNAPTIQNEFVTTTDSITMIWNVPDDNGGSAIIGYTVDYAIAPSGTWQTQDSALVMNTTRETTISGLDDNTQYNLRVAAVNDVGTGTYSDNATSTTSTTAEIPNKPTELSATRVDGIGTAILLVWNTPSSSDTSPIIDYTAEYKNTTSSDWIVFLDKVVSTNTTITVTGLIPGQPYDFRVYATNSAGNIGSTSDVLQATPATTPDVPENLNATRQTSSNTSVDLVWDPPTNNGGLPIIGYTINYTLIGNDAWIQFQDGSQDNTNVTSVTIPQLEPGQTYQFVIYAVNDLGSGSPTLPVISASPPDPPIGLFVTLTDTLDSVLIEWTEPPHDNGASITDYVVEYRSTDSTDWIVVYASNSSNPPIKVAITEAVPPHYTNYITQAVYYSDFSSDTITKSTFHDSATKSILVTGLDPGKQYIFRVSATNIAGTSTPSEIITHTTPPSAPDAPTKLTAIRGDLLTSVNLEWTTPPNNGAPITDYHIQYREDNSSDWILLTDGISNDTTYTIPSSVLSIYKTYQFQIYAQNDIGNGTISNMISITLSSTPDVPVNLSATRQDDNPTSVVLVWGAPSNNGGSAITGYTVEFSTDNIMWIVHQNGSHVNTNITTITIPGISKEYSFRVSAVNNIGQGSASTIDVASPITPPSGGTDPTVPLPPTRLTAIPLQDVATAIQLTWHATADHGGDTNITHYRVEYKTVDSAMWEPFMGDVDYTITVMTVDDLTPEQKYLFRVYAVNAVGSSPPSNLVSATPWKAISHTTCR